MDWQQLVSLTIVVAAAALMVGSRFRRRKFNFLQRTPCGCSAIRPAVAPNSIVFHARKGKRAEVVVKMN